MNRQIFSIAIDGASGVGKSTVAQILSGRLNILYLDTGAMYRAVGLFMLRQGIDPKDEAAVAKALPDVRISVTYHDGKQHTFLGGEDVSLTIRTQEIGQAASDVSRVREVRGALVARQREIAGGLSVVMDGRDIGTHVLPDATIKVFLTADAAIRAHRRVCELRDKGLPADAAEILAQINARDLQDSTRAQSPLKKARDAVEIRTDDMTAVEVADEIARQLSLKLGADS